MPTNPRPCPSCGSPVLALNLTEYRDNPETERVTSTVARYDCPCGNLFTCSFAADDREDEQADTDGTDLDSP